MLSSMRRLHVILDPLTSLTTLRAYVLDSLVNSLNVYATVKCVIKYLCNLFARKLFSSLMRCSDVIRQMLEPFPTNSALLPFVCVSMLEM